MDPIKKAIELGFADNNKVLKIAYQSDNIGNVIHLINIFRNAIEIKQIIVSLKEISIIVEKLC
jgi:hypothetical protein